MYIIRHETRGGGRGACQVWTPMVFKMGADIKKCNLLAVPSWRCLRGQAKKNRGAAEHAAGSGKNWLRARPGDIIFWLWLVKLSHLLSLIGNCRAFVASRGPISKRRQRCDGVCVWNFGKQIQLAADMLAELAASQRTPCNKMAQQDSFGGKEKPFHY